jgi:hypothetical protein
MPRHVVARAAEIPPGSRKLVHVGNRIVIFNIKGELFALSDKCPHKGGSLEGQAIGLVDLCARRIRLLRPAKSSAAPAQLGVRRAPAAPATPSACL